MDNLGIRIICAAATEIGYYNIYNMNTTVIRISQETVETTKGAALMQQPEPAGLPA